ncbi:MAG: cyclic nucleotide-binding domain-containing protein [Microthrixaceae bacterium]
MTRGPDVLAPFRNIPLSRECSDAELRQVDGVADEVRLDEGLTLVTQGSPGREFVVIVEGSADVVRDGETVATLGPGDHFGELALLIDHPRNASVVATTPLVAQVIERRAFDAVLDASPHLTRNLLTSLAHRLSEFDEQRGH